MVSQHQKSWGRELGAHELFHTKRGIPVLTTQQLDHGLMAHLRAKKKFRASGTGELYDAQVLLLCTD